MTYFVMTATHGAFRAVFYLGCPDLVSSLTEWLSRRGYTVETHIGLPDDFPRSSEEADRAQALTRMFELALASPRGS
jgi:hypothetical protein